MNASSISAQVGPDNIVPNLLQSPAALPIYKNDGTFLIFCQGFDQAFFYPINSLYNQTNDTNTKRLLANISGEYKIADGLTAKVLFGTDVVVNKQNRYLPNSTQEGLALKGVATIGNVTTVNWLNQKTINYSKTIGDIHSLNPAGFTAQRSTTEGAIAGASNFSSDFFEYYTLGVAVTPNSPSSLYSQWSLASWLARVNYSLIQF